MWWSSGFFAAREAPASETRKNAERLTGPKWDGPHTMRILGGQMTYWCVLRREWMGMEVVGMIIDSYCGSFSKIPCVKRTSKMKPVLIFNIF